MRIVTTFPPCGVNEPFWSDPSSGSELGSDNPPSSTVHWAPRNSESSSELGSELGSTLTSFMAESSETAVSSFSVSSGLWQSLYLLRLHHWQHQRFYPSCSEHAINPINIPISSITSTATLIVTNETRFPNRDLSKSNPIYKICIEHFYWSQPMTILQQIPLQMPWVTLDPFLFCVHHLDNYPEGDGRLGIVDSLEVEYRQWLFWERRLVHVSRKYHPRLSFSLIRFETLPLDVGFIDHSDSMGARARFGQETPMDDGRQRLCIRDVPLVNTMTNPTELFQIGWIFGKGQNGRSIFYYVLGPHSHCGCGRWCRATLFCTGRCGYISRPLWTNTSANSWASRPESDLAIWASKWMQMPI